MDQVHKAEPANPIAHGSDLFVSYAREDRETARLLADALTSEGWSVWSDHAIGAGERFQKAIKTALHHCRCVIVLWSAESVDSHYVCDEAAYGRDHRKLVPIRIDDVEIPIGFRSIHTADLIGWDGDRSSDAYRRIVTDIHRLLADQGVTVASVQKASPANPPSPPPAQRSRRFVVGFAALSIAAAGAAAVLGLIQNTPQVSRIDASVRATRVSFTYRQQQPQSSDQRVSPLFNNVRAQTVTIRSFSSIEIDRGTVSTREFRGTEWRSVDAQHPVTIVPTVEAAQATFHNVWIRTLTPPSTAQVEVSAIKLDREAGVTALLEGGETTLVVSHTAGGPAELYCDNCAVAGGSGRPGIRLSPGSTIRVADNAERLFTIAGKGTRLALDLVPENDALRKEQFHAEDVRFCEKPRAPAAVVQAAVSLTGGESIGINASGSTLKSPTLKVLASNPVRLSDLKMGFDPGIASSPVWFDLKVDGSAHDVRLGESCEPADGVSIMPSPLAARRPWLWALSGFSLVAFVAGIVTLYRGRT